VPPSPPARPDFVPARSATESALHQISAYPQAREAHPVALGGLLDLTAAVLARLPDVRLDRRPRMADYARVLAAVDQVRAADR
jgi:hypothetical protein